MSAAGFGAAPQLADASFDESKLSRVRAEEDRINGGWARQRQAEMGWRYYITGRCDNDALQKTSDFFAGMGDWISAGLTSRIRKGLGYDDVVDYDSGYYKAGEVAGAVVEIGLGGVNPCGLAKQGFVWTSRGLRALHGLGGAGQGLNALDSLGKASQALAEGDYAGALGHLNDGVNSARGAMGGLGTAWQPCFTARTLVLTSEGAKRFDELCPGDRVVASPEDGPGGERGPKLVEEVFRRTAPIWLLRTEGGVLETTDEHPFWVEGQGWTPTYQLQEGDRLLDLDGRPVAVLAVEETGRYEAVYNCRVAEWHTYFVRDPNGTAWVWSHNTRAGNGTCKGGGSVNGNSSSSKKPQHGYEIISKKKKDVVKTGVSGQPLNKDGTSPRANRQVNKWNKAEGAGKYQAKIKKKNVATREEILEWERQNAERLRKVGNSMSKHQKP